MKDLKENFCGLSEMSKKGIDVNEITEELRKIIELVKQDHAMMGRLSKENKIIVFKTTDTNRSITIELKDGNILGYIGEPERYDLRLAAKESIFLRIFNGEMDPDAVFFSRKIKIYGSIKDAVVYKNLFLNQLQLKMKILTSVGG